MYVHSKVLLGSVIAISIPLAPPLIALALITFSTGLKLFMAVKAPFTNRWMKLSKILYIIFHILLNLIMIVILIADLYVNSISTETYMLLGWMAIGFIFGCIFIDVLSIVLSVIYGVIEMIQQCK